jgi:hypothetical protein
VAEFGVVLIFGNKFPFVGRLPGEIAIERKNYSFYFPVATCITISIIMSFILWLFSKK